jgi:hypothetical protein
VTPAASTNENAPQPLQRPGAIHSNRPDPMEPTTTPPAAEQAIYQASAEAVTTIKNRLHAAGLHLQHHESLALALLIRDSIRAYIATTAQGVA